MPLKIFIKKILKKFNKNENDNDNEEPLNYDDTSTIIRIDNAQLKKLRSNSNWLNSSIIMKENESERLGLVQISKAKTGDLIYRATRDGFSPENFHRQCASRDNILLIIKTNTDHIFGGFISIRLNEIPAGTPGEDQKAYIFSLRRGDVSETHLMKIKRPKLAIMFNAHDFLGFGTVDNLGLDDKSPINFDIFLSRYPNKSEPNTNGKNHCNIGRSYEMPDGFEKYSTHARSFLTGSYSDWLTNEIEVYQLKF